jgi:hypothetical protein
MGAVCRYESDGSVSLVASWSEAGIHIPVGTRTGLEGRNVSAMVLQSGGPARLDSYEGLCGPLAALLREHGIRSSVGRADPRGRACLGLDDRLLESARAISH